MQVNMRRDARRPARDLYSLCWQDAQGLTQSVQVESFDISKSGVSLRCPAELPQGSVVYLEAKSGHPTGYCYVRSCCARSDHSFRIGLEFNEETKATLETPDHEEVDYYEFLQISPKAEYATIHRIYKFMASRLHPDNPETGDPERFLLLNQAYEVLSDPERRAAYDATYAIHETEPNPIFGLSEFVNGIEGEANRRLGILSLLYTRRRTNSEHPGIPMFEIEKRMGFPREYLDFTTWYLRSKQYVTMGDNAELALTAAGVDYVESNATEIPLLRKLLTSGPRTTTGPESASREKSASRSEQLVLGPGEVESTG